MLKWQRQWQQPYISLRWFITFDDQILQLNETDEKSSQFFEILFKREIESEAEGEKEQIICRMIMNIGLCCTL